MNISGIRPLGGFYDNNSIKIKPTSGAVDVTSVAASTASSPTQSQVSSAEDYSEARSRQSFGKYDYASQYKPGQTFSMKGADSSLDSLDVSAAIGSMQRDSALHQYQYFVMAPASTSDTASVRGAENFSL